MLAAAVAAVAACGGHDDDASKSVSDICAVVLDDPPRALQHVAARYPGKPVKIAAVIEDCVAPSGDDCERLDKIARVVPKLVAFDKAKGDPLAACRALPAPLQHCLLPSYGLANPRECATLGAGIRERP